MRADEELLSCKEVLAKVETERGALEVKLKHARNQVDVEIRRRQKAEAVYEKLVGTTLYQMNTFKGVWKRWVSSLQMDFLRVLRMK